MSIRGQRLFQSAKVAQKEAKAFTIVEVMIFLIITAALLISAMVVFQGRQERTQFTQAPRELDSRLRTTMNETVSGYFPDTGNFACRSVVMGTQMGVDFIGGNNEQGENEDCVFLGKIVHFCPGGNCKEYTVHTVAAPRLSGTGADAQEISQLADINAALIAPTTSDSSRPDLSQTYKIPYGLQVTKVVDGNGTPITAFGFITSLAEYSGDDPVSGSQNFTLLNLGDPLDVTALDNNLAAVTDTARDVSSITICLGDPGQARHSAIIIGGEGRTLSTEVIIDGLPEVCGS